jgi:hypothetical protein
LGRRESRSDERIAIVLRHRRLGSTTEGVGETGFRASSVGAPARRMKKGRTNKRSRLAAAVPTAHSNTQPLADALGAFEITLHASNSTTASARFSKFVIQRGTLGCELRKPKGTSNFMILVPLFDLKFLSGLAA